MNYYVRKPKSRWKRRTAVIALPLLLLLAGFTAWSAHKNPAPPPPPPPPAAPAQPVEPVIERPHIGVVLPLTGSFKRESQMLKGGIELAWAELQNGLEADLTIIDSGDAPERMTKAAETLAEDPQMLFVVAHLPVEVLTAIAPTFEKEHIMLLVPANSHEQLVDQPCILPFIASDRTEGANAARIAADWAKGGRAAVLYEPAPYGELLLQGFREAAASAKLDFVATALAANAPAAALDAAVRENPPVVWLAGSPYWSAPLVSKLNEKGFQGKILLPQSYDQRIIEDQLGKQAERLFFLEPAVLKQPGSDAAETFRASFLRTNLREPDALAALGYDLIRWAGKTLLQGPLSRQSLRGRLLAAATQKEPFDGVAGPVFFDSQGHTHRPLCVTTYQGGRFVPVP